MPAGMQCTVHACDALGRPTKVGSYLTGIGYYPNGEVAQATLGNGALYIADQNTRQLLSNFSYAKGSTVNLSEDLTYDPNGNITQITDLAGGPRSKTLAYDALNRLTSATASGLWGAETYAYDPINNLRSRINGSQTTTYNYNTLNQLSSLTGSGATTFGYDARGNQTNKGGVALGFDLRNQLLSLPGVSYAYDAAGRRVKKTVSGTDTYYFYSQAGQLLQQWEPGSNKVTNLIVLGRKPIARSVKVGSGAATVTYSYADAQGTPLAEANASGAVTATFDYRPYGVQALGLAPDGIGYTGHVNDGESGLVYMQARYYDPGVGRFLSVDPVGPSPGNAFNFNRYAYANNNPYKFTDPDGRFGRWVLITLPAGQNTIATDGNGGIKLVLGNSARAGPVQLESMTRHEQSHKDDFYRNATNPEILEGAAADQAVTAEDPIERAQGEVKASNVEIDYLNSQKNGSQNSAQRSEILARIRRMEEYRQAHQDKIDNPPPPPPPPPPLPERPNS